MNPRWLTRLGWVALALILTGLLLFGGVLMPVPPSVLASAGGTEQPISPQVIVTPAPALIIAAQSSMLTSSFSINIPLVLR